MHSGFTFGRKNFNFSCAFRAAIRSDLAKLEWFGTLAEHRQIIEEAFAAQTRGDGLMIVADVGDFPVAQLWVRFPQQRPPRFWAFRVMQPFRGLGLGSQLFRVGEKFLIGRRFSICEVGVEKSNPSVRRLYEKKGYLLSYEQTEDYSYVTPNGEVRMGRADQWILQKKLRLPDAESKLSLVGTGAEQGQPAHTTLFDG